MSKPPRPAPAASDQELRRLIISLWGRGRGWLACFMSQVGACPLFGISQQPSSFCSPDPT